MTKLVAEMHCVMSQIRKAKCTFYATHHGTVLCKVLCYQISVRLSIAACNNHHSFKMGSLTCAQKIVLAIRSVDLYVVTHECFTSFCVSIIQ